MRSLSPPLSRCYQRQHPDDDLAADDGDHPVVRLNSTSATVSYQGNDYLGAGNFGSIDSIADVPGDQGG